MPCKQMGSVDVNGVSTLHASNIKGKTFQFARALCPASCVDWASTSKSAEMSQVAVVVIVLLVSVREERPECFSCLLV